MIDRASLEKHHSDLSAEYERGESMLRLAEAEVVRIKEARLNIAGALKFVEGLLSELDASG